MSTKNWTGLWFEEKRNRWRVRLYHKRRVIHLSYHTTEQEARDVWRQVNDRLHNKPKTLMMGVLQDARLHYRTRKS